LANAITCSRAHLIPLIHSMPHALAVVSPSLQDSKSGAAGCHTLACDEYELVLQGKTGVTYPNHDQPRQEGLEGERHCDSENTIRLSEINDKKQP
jgi:hypothetical protein